MPSVREENSSVTPRDAEEVIQDGINGFVVERFDEAGLAQALLRLAQRDDTRTQFAKNTRVPPTIPSLDAYAEQIARDYETLLPKSFQVKKSSNL